MVGFEMFCERCGKRYGNGEASSSTSLPLSKRLLKAVGVSASAPKAPADEPLLRFCLACRGYSCPECWNEEAGFCQTCVPSEMPAVEQPAINVPALEMPPPVKPTMSFEPTDEMPPYLAMLADQGEMPVAEAPAVEVPQVDPLADLVVEAAPATEEPALAAEAVAETPVAEPDSVFEVVPMVEADFEAYGGFDVAPEFEAEAEAELAAEAETEAVAEVEAEDVAEFEAVAEAEVEEVAEFAPEPVAGFETVAEAEAEEIAAVAEGTAESAEAAEVVEVVQVQAEEAATDVSEAAATEEATESAASVETLAMVERPIELVFADEELVAELEPEPEASWEWDFVPATEAGPAETPPPAVLPLAAAAEGATSTEPGTLVDAPVIPAQPQTLPPPVYKPLAPLGPIMPPPPPPAASVTPTIDFDVLQPPPAYVIAPPQGQALMRPMLPAGIFDGPSPAIRPCHNCDLPVSAKARFCRRCGTAQPG